tara:strand:+ start:679 stop:951 length:273 start_codon:yes stop_codon:yes gene_type:complete
MINNNITIVIEMKNSDAVFACKKMIGFPKSFDCEIDIASDEREDSINSLTFKSTLENWDDTSRVIAGIQESGLAKTEELTEADIDRLLEQ